MNPTHQIFSGNGFSIPRVIFNFKRVILLLLLVVLAYNVQAQGTLFNITTQGNTSWATNGNWSTASHGGASCGCFPGDAGHNNATWNVSIGGSRTITLTGNYTYTLGNITVSDDGTTSALVLANNNAGVTSTITAASVTVNSSSTIQSGSTSQASAVNNLNVTGALTINSGTVTLGNNGNSTNVYSVTGNLVNSGNLVTGGNGGVTTTLNVGGILTNTGTFNLNVVNGDVSTLNFNGTGAQTINGSGSAFRVYNLTVAGTGPVDFGNASSTVTLTIANDATITSTLRAGSTGTNANTIQFLGNLIVNGTLDLTTNAATNQIALFAATTTKLFSGTNTTPKLYHLTVNGLLNFGNNANTRLLAVAGDATIGVGGVLQSGNTAAVAHTIQFSGNLVNNGTIDLTANSATNQTVVFNNGSAKSISGAGTNTVFNNFSMSTTGSASLNINESITISKVLTFVNPGKMVVNASSNVTMGAAATIAGAGSTAYIELDGTLGAGSQLIRNNAATIAGWQFLFPIGTAIGGYTPLDMTTAGISAAPTTGSALAVKAILNNPLTGHLKRSFRMNVTGNNVATTFTNAKFSYAGSDVSGTDLLSSYNTIWFLNVSTGTWVSVPGTAPGGTGFFTASTTGQVLSTGSYFYTIGSATFSNWYSYQTGNFSNVDNWTLDPSGTTLVNPFSVYPSDGDIVTILNGFTITADINNINLYSTTINGGGTLDMAATTGNGLGTVSGSGLLRVNGVGLPSGIYTSFVSAAGGTVDYYNLGGNLTTTQTTYNNLSLTNTTNSAITYVMASNLTVNSSLTINQASGTGTVGWQINDNSNLKRTVNIAGNLTVSNRGKISVGTGNATATTPHSLSLAGNFTNNGVVQFFDSTGTAGAIRYFITNYTNQSVYGADLQGNTVNVTFTGGTTNTVACNNHTDFYRLIVNKGTGQQAVLVVNSTNATFFRLYGPADLGSSGATSASEASDNAISIVNGTLELTGTMTIPLLLKDGTAANDYFAIPQNGAFWINGAGVNVTIADNATSNPDQRLMLQGLLQLTSGTLSFGYSKGLGSGDAGTVIVQGGTMNVFQIRPRAGSATQAFSYIQSGGTVNVGTTGYNGTPSLSGVDNTSYGRISIPVATSSFQMSGGTLNIGQPTSNSPGGIEIASSVSNYSVTGGTINAYIPASGSNFTINSTAPLNILNVYKEGGGGLTCLLQAPLVILKDLTLITGNTPTFACGNNALTIGGNFAINANTTFTPGTNILTFNGAAAQNWSRAGTITSLNNVVVNKTGVLTTLNTVGNMAGLTLTAGTLADNGNVITVTTTLSNSATHTSTAAGAIQFNGTTIAGKAGTFGNLTINNNGSVAMSGNQTVSGNLRLLLANSKLNIASNSLTVLGSIFSDAGTSTTFSTNKLIVTSGNRNDLGLTLKATPVAGSAVLTFPVGTGTLYTPNTMTIIAGSYGNVTVQPVASVHPNVTSTNQSVAYYWKVASVGFGTITSVVNTAYTYSTATRNTATNGYRAARWDPSGYFWTYNGTPYDATAGAGLTSINQSFNTNSGWSANAIYLDGEYTAGNQVAFNGVVLKYYSLTSGPWGNTSTWSNTAVGSGTSASIPCSTCPVVIGDNTHNHIITTANNQTCGSISIANGSSLQVNSSTGLNYGVYSQANYAGNNSTPGTIEVQSAGSFPAGDFRSFLGSSGGTVIWSGASSYVIPTLSLPTYYNLVINPASTFTISLPVNAPTNTLTVYNNLTVNGTALNALAATNNTVAGTVTVNNNLTVNSGTFSFTNGFASTLIVNGSTSIIAGASMSVPGGGTTTHTFSTPGNVVNAGTIGFRNGSVVNLTFAGPNSASLTTTGTTTINQLLVNLGTSQTPVLTISGAGTLAPLTNGWFFPTSGTTNFNMSGSITITDNSNFTIPAAVDLKVSSGNVSVCAGNDDDFDLLLIGKLEVAGGIFNVGPAGGTNNNDIEYASAGSPVIVVSGSGALNVIGSVRRPTNTLAGALSYNQGGTSTTTIYGINADNTRGVFEIENTSGSNFTLSGNANFIVQKTASGAFPDLYLNPATSSVSSTSTIQMGVNSGTAQTLTFNGIPVGNFSVVGGGAGTQAVRLVSDAMVVSGNLSICSTCTLNTNSLNVSIAGNLVTNSTGVYNGSANTTTFNGNLPQSAALSAGSNFQDVTISNAGNTVSLSGTAPTLTNLNILAGTLDVGSLTITVSGDIVIKSSQINTSGGAIALGGLSPVHTITSTGGSFGKLVLDVGSATKNVTVNGNLTVNDMLRFETTNRYLSIGSNQLSFSSSATVFGPVATAFIRTNGVTGDLGVVKTFPANTATTFTYAVGTGVNYTPLILTLNVNALAGGNITVVAVNQAHPTSNPGQQLLNYYWQVFRDNSIAYTATGSLATTFPSSLMGGTGGVLGASYFNPNASTLGWITGSGSSAATTTSMTFTNVLNTKMPNAGKYFDYSVGTSTSLPNPIVPVYSRLSDVGFTNNPLVGGSWSSVNSWTTVSTGIGAPVLTPPTGVPVVILAGARINMTSNARAAYTSKINGLLVLGTSYAHNLGIMSGTGTLRTATNTFPAGNYTTFVSGAGGTIEYVAPMTMNNRGTYNNLSFSGAGTVVMTNTDLILNGGLDITLAGITVDNTSNNRDITLAGNWSNSGTFNAGTGEVVLNGTSAETISGSTSFNDLTITSAGNVTLLAAGTTTVKGILNLISGDVIASSTHGIALPLTTSTISGGSASSFIQGPVTKLLSASGNIIFPLGKVSPARYRPLTIENTNALDTWVVEYVGNDPTTDGFSHSSFNTTNLGKVSGFEYWKATPGGANEADITISYNSGSYLNPPNNIGTVANLRVANWMTTQWDLPTGSTFSQAGDNISGTVEATDVTTFGQFTLASLDASSPLPITLLYFTGKRNGADVELEWKTAQEINNDHFEIERSIDGLEFTRVGSLPGAGNSSKSLLYKYTDSQVPLTVVHYYRLKQLDFDGTPHYSKLVAIGATGDAGQRWAVYPNPYGSGQALHMEWTDPKIDPTSMVQISLTAFDGRTVFEGVAQLELIRERLEREFVNLSSGVYLLQITDGQARENYRIIRY